MPYSRNNLAEEQRDASQKARRITEICEELSIKLDPIDWQQYGLRAPVAIQGIEIDSLANFSEPDPDDILRRVRINLLGHAALAAAHARPGCKAVMWTPVDVVQPQSFLSLWVIMLETDERIAVVELMKNGQRTYEPYKFDRNDTQQLATLFGPLVQGEYKIGTIVSAKERDRQYTGEVVYIIPSDKAPTSNRYSSRGFHTIAGTTYKNDAAPKYIIDCNDSFPHIVPQAQISLYSAES
jgi:hypothetical protein